MYTSDDVLEMMDSLPLNDRLFVVEETMRKLRNAETPPLTSSKLKKVPEQIVTEPTEKGRLKEFSGSITDADAEDMLLALKEPAPYKHPFLQLAGTWTDQEAEEFKAILADGDKIDYDGW